MAVTAIFANLSCCDLARSRPFFAAIFARQPDAAPMDGLLEWHHGGRAGFQLFREPAKAGNGTLTLIVAGLEAERARLADAGIAVPAAEIGAGARIVRLADPDGNLVVLAELG